MSSNLPNNSIEYVGKLKNDPKLMEYFVNILAKDDPIMKEVWNHYHVQKRTEPLDPWRVMHFWDKLKEVMANHNYLDKKGVL